MRLFCCLLLLVPFATAQDPFAVAAMTSQTSAAPQTEALPPHRNKSLTWNRCFRTGQTWRAIEPPMQPLQRPAR